MIPSPGDILTVFLEWKKTKQESREKTLRLLEDMVREVEDLALAWGAIAQALRAQDPEKLSAAKLITDQRGHYEAILKFCEVIGKIPQSQDNDFKRVIRILDDAIGMKSQMRWALRSLYYPSDHGLELDPALPRENPSPPTPKKKKTERLRVQRLAPLKWPYEHPANELEDNEERAIKTIEAGAEELRGLSGVLRTTVALYRAELPSQ